VAILDANTTTLQPDFEFIGENLALDFANTFGGLPPDSLTQERLTRYRHLVAWSQQANLLSKHEADVLLREAERSQVEADEVLARAQAMRNAIRAIFTAVGMGTDPSERDLMLFNGELARAMAGAEITVTADGFALEWQQAEDALDRMIAPVVRSAATLLTSAERQYVRKCANHMCTWLFVDTTKNHRRQWCKTSGCGNVMRVRKHRERQRNNETD
jgi:predicted RNA-binding Zn ribbon-like protein